MGSQVVTCSTCNNNVTVRRNRHVTIQVTVLVDEEPLNIVGAKVWASVKSDLDDADTDALIYKRNAAAGGDDSQAEITDGTNGVFCIYIVPDDTVDMEAGDYMWDAVIETTIPRKIQVVNPSRFSVVQPVTLAQ